MKRPVGFLLLVWLASLLAVHSVVAEPDGKNKTDTPPLGFANEFQLDPFGAPAVSPEEALVITAEIKIKKGSRDGTLAVKAKPAPGWYTYSMTQPDGGGLPSIVTVSKSDEYSVDVEKFQASHAPTIVKDPDFKVPQEKHKKPVTWTAPLRLADGAAPESLKIKLTYNGQVCEENGKCIPIFDRKVVASFAGYYEPVRAVGPEYKAPRTHVMLSGHIEPKVASPGDVVQFVLTATPDLGYHVYPYSETDPVGGFKPTLIALEAGSWIASKPVTSDKTVTKDDLTYHEGPTTWTVQLQVPKDAKPGEQTIKGWLGYQGCTESTCDLPSGAAFTVTVGVADQTTDGKVGLSFAPVSYGAAAKAAEEAAKPKPQPVDAAQALAPPPSGEFRASERSHVLIQGRVEPKVAAPGDKIKLVLTAVPDSPYHVYRLATGPLNKGSAEPTLIALTKTAGWKVSPITPSKPTIPDPKNVAYYDGSVNWTIQLDVPNDAAPGNYELEGVIGYQVCIKDGACDPPRAAKFSVTVPVAADSQTGQLPLVFQKASYTSAENAAKQFPLQIVEVAGSQEVADAPFSVLLVAAVLLLGFLATFVLCGGVWKFNGLPATLYGMSLLLVVVLVAAVLHQLDKPQTEPTLWTLLAVAFGAWLIARVPEKTSAAKRALTIGVAAGIAVLIGASFFIGKEVVPACALIGGGSFAIWIVMKIPNGATLGRKAYGFLGAAVGLLVAVGIAWIALQATELPWEEYSPDLLQTYRDDGNVVLVDFTADW